MRRNYKLTGFTRDEMRRLSKHYKEAKIYTSISDGESYMLMNFGTIEYIMTNVTIVKNRIFGTHKELKLTKI